MYSDSLVATRWGYFAELGGRHFLETEPEDRGSPAVELVTVGVAGKYEAGEDRKFLTSLNPGLANQGV